MCVFLVASRACVLLINADPHDALFLLPIHLPVRNTTSRRFPRQLALFPSSKKPSVPLHLLVLLLSLLNKHNHFHSMEQGLLRDVN
jgi:hypothetical protein